MNKNEKATDLFIGRLLDAANIKYTPNGSDIKEIQTALKTASKKGTGNVGFPEFVALSKDFVLVIENKADFNKQAFFEKNDPNKLKMDTKSIVGYAENGALHYAKVIVERTAFKKVFAFGCSGNEKHHCIRPLFVDSNGYTIMNKVENFENFRPINIEKFYKEQVLLETPKEVKDKEAIIKEAQTLHEHLRNYGQLGESEKPLVVSAILLALCDERNFKVDSLVGDDIDTDGEKIFRSIDNYMKKVKVTPTTKKEKVLSQFSVVKDRALLNQIDDRLEKTPLRYFAEFLRDKILESVKANHIEDVLGRFYGEFISFSGGDGQTLGVVLTPSHITELFCDLVDIKSTDRVLDPCCGTGGFLIAAMHRMIEASNADQIKSIKRDQLHGIEIREDMFSIATTNMILRGDGKSNLENLNFLKISEKELRKKNCTVGFINPPYSQSKGKETSHLSEIGFIEHLLNGLADRGRCAVIVPQSTMVGKTKEDKLIKERILKRHSLEGVITLNKNTFYGVGTNPCIAVFTAHEPHRPSKRCKFINFEDDGFVISKHIGLVKSERSISQKEKLLRCWRDMEDAESKFLVKTTIEASDEWLHSFYYFNDEFPKDIDFDKNIGDYLAFQFNMIMQNKMYLFEKDVEQKISNLNKKQSALRLNEVKWGEFFIEDIFHVKSGKRLKKSEMNLGRIPFVGASDSNNGITSFISNKNSSLDKNVLGVNYDGSVVENFYHPYQAVFSDSVKRLTFKNIEGNKFLYLFAKTMILQQKSKYQYAYKFNEGRMLRQKILLPINSRSEPDYSYMENYVRNLEAVKLNAYAQWISLSC